MAQGVKTPVAVFLRPCDDVVVQSARFPPLYLPVAASFLMSTFAAVWFIQLAAAFEIDAQEHVELVAAMSGQRLISVDFIVEIERLAFELRGQRALGVVDLDQRCCATGDR